MRDDYLEEKILFAIYNIFKKVLSHKLAMISLTFLILIAIISIIALIAPYQ